MFVVTNDGIVVTDPINAVIRHSKVGGEILYHLAKNPAEVARISQLPPVAQVREVDKIEATILADGQIQGDPAVTQPVKETPKPLTPVKPGGETTPRELDKLSAAEYRKRRETQGVST